MFKRLICCAFVGGLVALVACGGPSAAASADAEAHEQGTPDGDAGDWWTASDSGYASDVNLDATTEGIVKKDSGPVGPVDDPCPNELAVNCSTSCGESNCYGGWWGCSSNDAYTPVDDVFPFILRTPSSPKETQFSCRGGCGNNGPIYGAAFRLKTFQSRVRVRVDPPWMVAHKAPYIPAHPSLGMLGSACGWLTQCVSVEPESPSWYVRLIFATFDPKAPARNVVIEATEEPCAGGGDEQW